MLKCICNFQGFPGKNWALFGTTTKEFKDNYGLQDFKGEKYLALLIF